jgi:hypothetical protein
MMNQENPENKTLTEQLKQFLEDCEEDFDTKTRRILAALRESWVGIPYDEDVERYRRQS